MQEFVGKSAMTGLRLQRAGTGLPLGTMTVGNHLFKGENIWLHLQFVCAPVLSLGKMLHEINP